MPTPRAAPRISSLGRMYDAGDRRAAAPLPRTATPPSPAFSTITPCSRRRCSICTKPQFDRRDLELAVAPRRKTMRNCSKIASRRVLQHGRGRRSEPGACASRRTTMAPNHRGNSIADTEPAAPGPDHRPRRFSRLRRARPGRLRPASGPRSGCPAAHAHGLRILLGRAAPDRRRRPARLGRHARPAARLPLPFRAPIASCCWWIPTKPAARWPRGIPAIDAMQPAGGIPTAYVCRNYACQLPVTEAAQLAELLQ